GRHAAPLASFLWQLLVAARRPQLGDVPERLRASARRGHIAIRPATWPCGAGCAAPGGWERAPGGAPPSAFLHVVCPARIDQELDRDLVGKGAGLAGSASLHACR